jgi:hypothetical protein
VVQSQMPSCQAPVFTPACIEMRKRLTIHHFIITVVYGPSQVGPLYPARARMALPSARRVSSHYFSILSISIIEVQGPSPCSAC